MVCNSSIGSFLGIPYTAALELAIIFFILYFFDSSIILRVAIIFSLASLIGFLIEFGTDTCAAKCIIYSILLLLNIFSRSL